MNSSLSSLLYKLSSTMTLPSLPSIKKWKSDRDSKKVLKMREKEQFRKRMASAGRLLVEKREMSAFHPGDKRGGRRCSAPASSSARRGPSHRRGRSSSVSNPRERRNLVLPSRDWAASVMTSPAR